MQMPLNQGWNIIGYPQEAQFDGKEVVQQLINRGTLIKVQDEKGLSIEDYGIFGGWTNNIGNFKPGEGYKVKVAANETLTINPSYAKSGSLVPEFFAGSHFQTAMEGNGVDHMNINILGIPQNLLQPGDEIGIFDGDLCVGSLVIGNQLSQSEVEGSVIGQQKSGILALSEVVLECSRRIEGRNLSIPVSAMDDFGGLGFTEGNSFTLRIWKAEAYKEFAVEPEIIKGTTTFLKHESTFVSLKNLVIGRFDDLVIEGAGNIRIYPNPTGGKVYIQASSNALNGTQVRVFNAIGQQVMNKTTIANPEVIDLSGNVSGIYYIHLTGNPWSKTEKIILK
jgi:hypothetical protein